MNIPEGKLTEFIELYQQRFNKTLQRQEAYEKAMKLIVFIKQAQEPNNQTKPNIYIS